MVPFCHSPVNISAFSSSAQSETLQTIDFARHTPAMDVFALGVILFIMLTGQKPMKTEQAAKLSYCSLEADEYPRMASHSWTRLSTPAKDLVLRMLERTPAKRITAAEVICSLRTCDSLVLRTTCHPHKLHALVHAAAAFCMGRYIPHAVQ